MNFFKKSDRYNQLKNEENKKENKNNIKQKLNSKHFKIKPKHEYEKYESKHFTPQIIPDIILFTDLNTKIDLYQNFLKTLQPLKTIVLTTHETVLSNEQLIRHSSVKLILICHGTGILHALIWCFLKKINPYHIISLDGAYLDCSLIDQIILNPSNQLKYVRNIYKYYNPSFPTYSQNIKSLYKKYIEIYKNYYEKKHFSFPPITLFRYVKNLFRLSHNSVKNDQNKINNFNAMVDVENYSAIIYCSKPKSNSKSLFETLLKPLSILIDTLKQ